ncbi:SDR family NAD(P)-dependent oxidoreductase [Azohydromonas australica]|uniref:SDR family NAD(P)-dependent oxidoreductase n=1 Tax=Azohydromonas australica TaxID=364039 RepID=UPI000491651A|nr:SDR family oxidoreductase [Azohydromonas australica]
MANDGSDSWLGLAGRVCVVTGAGSGIGEGVARELALLGAYVAVLDRDEKSSGSVAASIRGAGGQAVAVVADVADESAVAAAAQLVANELGPCQVLVNNAALVSGSTGALMTADLGLWNRMLGVNLTGALICTRAFAAQMVAMGHGGSIVNVSSICGHMPRPLGGAYSVSKAGLMMMTRMLSLELAEHRIRCNSVSPAWVRTPASEAIYSDPEIGGKRRQLVPVGRISDPVDLANAVAFLASDRAGYVNGQDILVDGGLTQTLLNMVPKPSRPMTPDKP